MGGLDGHDASSLAGRFFDTKVLLSLKREHARQVAIPKGACLLTFSMSTHWRQRADEARALAEQMSDPASRAALLRHAVPHGSDRGLEPRRAIDDEEGAARRPLNLPLGANPSGCDFLERQAPSAARAAETALNLGGLSVSVVIS
jgi:hypothetical protein